MTTETNPECPFLGYLGAVQVGAHFLDKPTLVVETLPDGTQRTIEVKQPICSLDPENIVSDVCTSPNHLECATYYKEDQRRKNRFFQIAPRKI